VGASSLVVLFLLAGCGASPRSASRTSRPVSSTSTTTTTSTSVPYTGPKLTSVLSVSCADAMHCWAGALAGTSGDESAILASTDGGATWTVQDLIPGVDDLGTIDCPSDTHCLAAGDRVASNEEPPLLLSTTDGGATWSMQAMSSGVFALDAMSCLNDSDCWLVAEKPQGFDLVMATTNWGESWTVQDQSSIEVSMGVSYGISCPSTSHCVIVGIGALTTTNGGSTWQKHTFPQSATSPGELNVLSCPSLSLCLAEEDVTSAVAANTLTVIATSQDGGASWQDVKTVNGQVFRSISCPTTAICLSTSSIVEKTADGGSTWTEAPVPPQASYLDGISCTTGTTDCVAVGSLSGSTGTLSSATGIILKTVDDGSTWTEASLPTP
jgi:photosystem II stability/assembly factor-like uncharacterized protein